MSEWRGASCKECDRPVRPRGMTSTQAPGTLLMIAGGLCSSCYQKNPSLQYDANGSTDLTWQDDAPCSQTDPEAFFPKKGEKAAGARTICGTCEKQTTCLLFALANGYNNPEDGIWGGLTYMERRRLLKVSVA